MQTNVEDLGALERRLNVSVPQEKIETEIESRLKHLARTAKLPGFRPGKVPLKIVMQQYGPQVRQEVISDVLKKNFNDAVREKNLRIAGYPRFEPREAAENATQFEFSATFEVYPEVVLGNLGEIRIERPVVNISESDIDKTIDVLRKQRVQYEPAERGALPGDRINIDYHGIIDGVEFAGGKAENFTLVLGEGKLLKDFEEPLIGMSAGQVKTFEVTFPADYHGKEVAGKTATFEVSLNGVESSRLPDADMEFARSLGVADGDTEKMRVEIEANLEREASRRVKARLKEQVMQALLDVTSIQPPKALVEMEQERLMQEAREELTSRGLSAKNLPLSQDLLLERAQRRVNLGLILGELVKSHSLHPKPEQVRAVVEDLAQSYENPAEVIKWHYSVPDRLNEVESAALEDNVVMWVLEKVTVVDKLMTLDELMGRS
ncbi:trigger factor [Nitrosospira sp. Nsp11]|uniref:trigger factor n=1 Tax=Nitrosospira sp. Nsp11 TaxID=1855338 RepID=UPI000915309D|nr:trigger factor [Nitrosospira sp. Nsp11]SHL95967.1 trigger factor [Nitrosospira sp. Nsp11]